MIASVKGEGGQKEGYTLTNTPPTSLVFLKLNTIHSPSAPTSLLKFYP